MYNNRFRSLPEVLSFDEQQELFKKIKLGDTKAKELIILSNIKLVIYEVNTKFNNTKYSTEDLIGTGLIGLLKAVNSFDISKNIKFATYASRCIDNEILMVLRVKNVNVISLSDYLYDDSGKEVMEIPDDIDITREYEDKDMLVFIYKIIDVLPEREKQIITMAMGLFGSRTYSQREIASYLNLSQGHVSRIVNRVLLQIRDIVLISNNIDMERIKRI